MILFAFFTNTGVPALGLFPTIDVWDSAANHPVNAQAMAEIAGGWYQYNFAAYNDTVDYIIRADGTAVLSNFERYVFGSNECDSSVAASEVAIIVEIDANEAKIDIIQTDLDNPNQYKANVAALAIEANIEGHVTNSLNTYDPPTRTEATADKDAIITEVNANETKIDAVQADLNNPDQYKANVAALAIEANVEGHVTNSLNTYDPPTRTEATADKDAIITEVNANEAKIDIVQVDLDNPNQYKANITTLAIEANVEGHVTNSLNLYDPPTRAEATLDKDEIVIEVNANEVKIDAMTIILDFLRDIEGGRWRIVNDQMLFYEADNVTLVATFDLLDSDGNPSMENVAERRRI